MAELTGRQWKLQWNADPVIKEVKKRGNTALYEAAKIVERHVKRKFKERTYGTGTGELFASMATRKSKYDGWIVGVFGQPTAKWEDSLGARAIFFEFGRAGKGHKSRDTAAGRKARQANKVQPPRPFFRPGLKSAGREIKRKLGLTSRRVRRFYR